jgi:hypothetical protein
MEDNQSHKRSPFHFFNNWVSLAGAVIAIGSGFAFLLLFAIDGFTRGANPYIGILTYLASPAFFVMGAGLAGIGWVIYRRQLKQTGGFSPLTLSLDFSKSSDRRKFFLFTSGTFVFLIVTAMGSYRSYHFTESVEFCGEVCHTVMEPEYVTYRLGAHARISCAECHIGSGAEWYVKSKLSGLYQIYSVMFDKYSRPIPTPVHNLRPSQETCEQCHWPEKFTGNLDRTYARFLADDDNTPYTIRLSLKVGGGDPRQGPLGGIHWHHGIGNLVEYIAIDERNLVIPWVRVTRDDGEVIVYTSPEFDESQLLHHTVRKMDCIDCHNRPAHVFHSPNDAVDLAMYTNKMDRTMPGLKRLAVELLTGEYETRDEAFAAIAAGVHEAYNDDSRALAVIAELQQIYQVNFFPVMNADWSAYPNHIGHKDWPGCFRCHSDEHESLDGQHVIQMSDCNECHTILAQGSTPAELRILHPEGDEFNHPAGPVGPFLCSECHWGGLVE